MTLNDYQKQANRTAFYPNKLSYTILGLAGEAGEVANKYKKVVRDNNGVLTEADVDGLIKELGDVLWYVAMCAEELKIPLDFIAKVNLKKLADRQKKNTLSGSGDDR